MAQDESARTMRIDIRPGPSEAGHGSGARRREDASSFVGVDRNKRGYTPDFERLLESIYDSALLADFKGRIVDFNSRALNFFLCEANYLYGVRFVDLISGADESVLAAILKNLKRHKYTLIEAYCLRRDRTLVPAEVAVNKLDLDGRELLCLFVRDITVRKRAEEALQDAVRRLEEHDRAKSQFISNVSHELRTPLTSMIYAVSNMLRGVVGPLPDRVREYLEILNGDCRRMLGTVNDILDLRKLESRSLTLSMGKVPYSRLIRRSAESLRVQANQKRLQFKVTARERGLFVNCDPQKIERVVINTVGNAVKFTSDGGSVRVTVERDPRRADMALLSVVDNGVGIPVRALPRVTERYFTVGEQACGSGLGLAISKEIVELHGGTLEVHSPAPGSDRGTAVTVRLPLCEPPRVLVVDDDAGVAELLRQQVSGSGYTVISARDGAEAFRHIKEELPDVVVLDLLLPEMEGTTVVVKMKSDKHLMRIPVIAMSGAPIGPAKTEILSNFSIPLLQKPWKEDELLGRLEESLLAVSGFAKPAVLRIDKGDGQASREPGKGDHNG